MNRRAREFVDWVVDNGYGTLDGQTNGDHLSITLRNGKRIIHSSTPGAYTATKNAKGEVLRALGIGSQSPAAGKIRFKPAAEDRRAAAFDGPLTKDLQERVAAIDSKLARIGDPRSGHVRRVALELVRERLECTEEIERRGMNAKQPPVIERRTA